MVFSGTVISDYLKLVSVESQKKDSLIDYASTDFLTLKQSLINYIKAVYPLDYQNFAETDLGMMLLELVAYMGSVLSLKADLLANESFLRTARNRNNVKKLLELIGVTMRGPISAAANARLTITPTPGWVSPTSSKIILPAAKRVVSIISSEDNAPITYTIYKVVNGNVETANSTGEIYLYDNEADNYNSTTTGAGSVFSNLVLLEGAMVTEQGVFTNTEFVKTVPLTQSPAVEGSISVFVNGNSNTSGAYTKVDNIYFASGSSSKVFQVVYNEDYAATVIFGDGTLGTSPSVGDSYLITYRVGGGSRGNIASRVINLTLESQFTSDSIAYSNISPVIINTTQGVGGSDAETVSHAKKYAPLTFRRQDRIVTLEDFKTFTNTYISSYGSIGKATAIVRRAYSSANIINIFVLEKANNLQLRRATPTYKKNLLDAINAKKMLTDEVVIVDGLIRTLDLAVTINLEKELRSKEEVIKARVRDTILDYFSVDNNDFNKPLIVSELNRTIFSVDEVRYSSIDNITDNIIIDFNEIIQLNNLNITVKYV